MPFLKTSEDFWDKIIDINFEGRCASSTPSCPAWWNADSDG